MGGSCARVPRSSRPSSALLLPASRQSRYSCSRARYDPYASARASTSRCSPGREQRRQEHSRTTGEGLRGHAGSSTHPSRPADGAARCHEQPEGPLHATRHHQDQRIWRFSMLLRLGIGAHLDLGAPSSASGCNRAAAGKTEAVKPDSTRARAWRASSASDRARHFLFSSRSSRSNATTRRRRLRSVSGDHRRSSRNSRRSSAPSMP